MKLTINFTLKSGVSGKAPIQAFLSYGNKQFDVTSQKTLYKPIKYYTGLTMFPSEWNTAKKQPYNTKTIGQLENIEETIKVVFKQHYAVNKAINAELLKEELDEVIKGKRRKRDIQLRIRIADFITKEIIPELEKKEADRIAAGGKKGSGTKSNYDTLLNYVEAFEQETGKPLYNHELTEAVFNRFMNLVREKNKRYNSVTHIYNTFKAVLARIGKDYKVPVFNPTEELDREDKQTFIKTAKVPLNFEQIQQVIDFDPKTKVQSRVKLIFLTLLFTGCRYSDVFKIKPEYIYMKGKTHFRYAKYISQKTNIEVAVPILKPLEDAIRENDGETAEVMDLSYFNKEVKKLCQDCGLTALTTISFTDSYGVKQFVTEPLYKFMSSHTGRRSLVTNLRSYISDSVLTKITGHVSEETGKSKSAIDDYDQITPEENAAIFYRMLSKLQILDEEHFIYPLAA